LRAAPILIAFALVLPVGSEAAAQLLSPGPLTRAHHALEGDARCLDCHSSGKRVDDGLCLKCHQDVDAARRAGKGLHGKSYRDKRCGECHLEHRGLDYHLVRWPGGSLQAFDHATTGWPLRDAHAKVKCDACHKTKNERGAQTFIGLGTACTSCHEDPHQKRFGNDCTQCHDERSFKAPRLERFDHALARFALKGKHAEVACAKCHGAAPAPVTWKGLDFASCTSCHKDPHAGRFGSTCTSCHSENGWKDAQMKREAHPGLNILGGHARVPCATCHDRGLTVAPTKGSRCVACHAPVHEAKFGNECAECHRGIRWLGLPDELGRRVHGQTAFPLRGRHEAVRCEGCHAPRLPPAKRYRALAFAQCRDCHRDPHAGEFAARDGGECGACHDEHGFAPTSFGVEAHATTAFPLVGSHEAVACGGCHKDPHPRLSWKLADARCEACHQNPHGDQFAREMRDGGCAHCHAPVAWNVPNIDHRTWPLTGAHARAACASCHARAAGSAGTTAAADYRGVPRECEGCHDDVHLGQFRLSEPVRTCADCHRTESFKIAKFDHDELTRYPLEGKHEDVACAKCHAPATLRDGKTAVRYRIPFRACADCHANPHREEAR
jgi:hypothetical protein